MAEEAAPRDVLAEVMDGGKKAIVPHLAEMLRRKGIAEVPTAEQMFADEGETKDDKSEPAGKGSDDDAAAA
mgnify:CR=1 FL=1